MKILSFGEVLWDMMNGEAHFGGAAVNYAAHIVKLGGKADQLSAVGCDELGDRTLDTLSELGIGTEFVVRVPYQTGICNVTFDGDKPNYELAADVAYDHISLSEASIDQIRKRNYDLLYFGTLAQRSEDSRDTLRQLLRDVDFPNVFCDINIRQNWYSRESVQLCLESCTILKISRDEINIPFELGLSDISRKDYDAEYAYTLALCSQLCRTYDINTVIVTRDKDGAYLYRKGGTSMYVSSSPKSNVISAVGAGDSFSACYTYNILNGATSEQSAERAVKLSDFVVTRYGAIPDYPKTLISEIK